MRYHDFSLPTIVGHRGVTETGPENTLGAIERAADEGATWVEFDVQLSGDNIPLVIHDETLDRTTDGAGRLIDRSAASLTSLDAGKWFHKKFEGQKIPTFLEIVDLCDHLGLGMNIEIKPGLGDHAGTTAAALKDLEKFNWKDTSRLLISSFEHQSLVTAHQLAPAIPRGYLLHEIPSNWLMLLREIEATTLHSNYETFSMRHQELIQAEGYPIMLYSVDTPQAALRMLNRGVETLCTGTPALIAKTAEDAGFHLHY